MNRARPIDGETKAASPLKVVAWTTAGAAVITAIVIISPSIRLAFRNPALHVALETAVGLIALLTAYLVVGRFQQSHALMDLLLFCALLVLGFTNLVFGAGALVVMTRASDVFATWAAVGGRTLGHALMFWAAFVSTQRKVDREGSVTRAIVASIGALAMMALVVALFYASLPSGVETKIPVGSSARPVFVGHPFVHGVHLLAAILYGGAAIGFAKRASHRDDDLMLWLSCACVLAAFASINYYVFPTLYSAYVFMGDAFRLTFYLVLLVGALREIGTYWQGVADRVLLEERRRVARELHDGLAQEISFVVTRVRGIIEEQGTETPELHQVATAAENALFESRRAISALTDPVGESLDVALGKLAAEITQREGLGLDLNIQADVHVEPKIHEQVLRIAREAMNNAVRHGKPSKILIELQNLAGLSLVVEDDGRGFLLSESSGNGSGFGLISMKERVKALSGQIEIRSQPGSGTRVEVLIPEVER